METNFNTNMNTHLETTHTIDLSDRMYKLPIIMITVIGLVGAGWVFSEFAGLPQNQPHEIQVSGEGKAYLKPDVAMVSFGVSSQAMKSQDAVNQNNTKMNAVIAAIKSLGVQDKDIQTTLYQLSPVYGYDRGGIMPMDAKSGPVSSPMYYPMPGNQVVTGYSLEQQVSVKIRNFDNINSILDKATAAGANNVGQLSFTVDNPEMARSEAREKAILAAKEKMENIARASGLQVGKLVNVYEGYNNYPQPMYAEAMAKDSGGGSVAPQIQTGQMEVSSSVTLTFQVK
ncbi:MAG: hypothetical protein A3C06_00745 [Candidatus Taylorbacteria bacterium RIFCSPHIGHO2_02_FULL_46_13]|uniref:SIMPL domain-containing protein n=2 Tax=Parcubacteria group TaxID=1794811 RepID=A0A1G2HT08_9BACT|nr:MAG: hypothetical protein A2822_03555 [Candidatus Staskawiczbacteria bacterium RIFCSPHIGHO2_01_FULL_41_41]OGZ75023.1 MAG: hypothetical protein A3A12_04335 [Candidatus Staskawiczbacteria bacterium RIFCSPLOWO2_01_FULL_43_17b]OHA26066.1 MAG: hypothetical protein A3C06_00745 [Candidatus Taylorbacteria bacterium RIFCSPHIGHO2_02_FULL_46_13]